MAIAGALIGKAMGAFGKKPEVPELPVIDPTKIQEETVAGNLKNLPAAQQLGAAVNQFNQQQTLAMLKQALPGMLDQANSVVGAQLRGEIPQDVARQVQDRAAALSFGSGFGGSGLAKNLTARDLGLTSLQLQQQGLSNFGSLATLTRGPQFDVTSMFFSPQQRLQFQFQDRAARFQRDLLNAQVEAAPDPADVALAKEIDSFFNTWISVGTMALGGMGGGGGGSSSMFSMPSDVRGLNMSSAVSQGVGSGTSFGLGGVGGGSGFNLGAGIGNAIGRNF